MTPRRIELLAGVALALGALVVVSYLAIVGVEIAQGALIGAVGAAIAHFLHTQPPNAEDAPRRRSSDPPPIPPTGGR